MFVMALPARQGVLLACFLAGTLAYRDAPSSLLDAAVNESVQQGIALEHAGSVGQILDHSDDTEIRKEVLHHANETGEACPCEAGGCSFTTAPADDRERKLLDASSTLFRRRVELVSSKVPIGCVFYAFHTSIIMENTEIYFAIGNGIYQERLGTGPRSPRSHIGRGYTSTTIEVQGHTIFNSDDLKAALEPFFQRNSYDILKKNCNTFTDMALYFLLGKRIFWNGRFLEQSLPEAVKRLGGYVENDLAKDYSDDKVMSEVKEKLDEQLEAKLSLAAEAHAAHSAA